VSQPRWLGCSGRRRRRRNSSCQRVVESFVRVACSDVRPESSARSESVESPAVGKTFESMDLPCTSTPTAFSREPLAAVQDLYGYVLPVDDDRERQRGASLLDAEGDHLARGHLDSLCDCAADLLLAARLAHKPSPDGGGEWARPQGPRDGPTGYRQPQECLSRTRPRRCAFHAAGRINGHVELGLTVVRAAEFAIGRLRYA
jgi:hypothetical protein